MIRTIRRRPAARNAEPTRKPDAEPGRPGARSRAVATLFGLNAFVAATLLFSVQPMVARQLLPALGGTPAVWTTCMLFFQAVLLAGYAAAHGLTSRLRPSQQVALQAVIVLGPFLTLPMRFREPGASVDEAPTTWLLQTLLLGVGPSFFALAMTAPLLQRWYACTGQPDADDPYFLYASSNAGSLLALLAYPLVLEPMFGLRDQAAGWAVGYLVYAALIVASALRACRTETEHDSCVHAKSGKEPPAPTWGRWWGWVGLAFLPSSALLGVTSFLTSDVGALPLLWVLPLGLYLLSFIAVFAARPWTTTEVMGPLMGGLGLIAAWSLTVGATAGFGMTAVHLGAFLATALYCHGRLAEGRPGVAHLTSFYLSLSLGGVLGGLFNAIGAPLAFDRYCEYPMILVACALALSRGAGRTDRPGRDVAIGGLLGSIAAGAMLLNRAIGGGRSAAIATELGVAAACVILVVVARGRPRRWAIGLAAILAAGVLPRSGDGRVLLRDRSFFGAVRVEEDADGRFRRLVHGVTIHGRQALDPGLRDEPLAYYHRTGPIGDLFRVVDARGPVARVGVVGLGAGAIAAYARPSDRFEFFEIDPAVVRIARDRSYFRYLSDCPAGPPLVRLGDARRRLREVGSGAYDLLVLDAFSSDAIPTHLLTREALALDRAVLRPGGLIAVHISNRHVDLRGVLWALAADVGWVCRVRADLAVDRAEDAAGKSPSVWAVLAARPDDLGALADDPAWVAPPCPDADVWTDDRSDLIRTLKVVAEVRHTVAAATAGLFRGR